MQNSIWKLTALAGVIGVGFLIVLQAQDGLNRDGTEPHALVPSGAPKPGDPNAAAATPGSGFTPRESNAASLWGPDVGPEAGPGENTEPEVSERPAFEPRSPEYGSNPGVVSIADPGLGPDPFEADSSAIPAFDTPPAVPEPGRFAERNPLPSPSILTAGVATPGLPLPPQTPDPSLNQPGDFPRFTTDVSPALPEPSAIDRSPTPRQESDRLMAEAREAMDAGKLLTAREKAQQAAAIPAVYGPLEVRPAGLIRQIDAMLDAATVAASPVSLPGLPSPDEPDFPTVTPPLPLIAELPSPFPTELGPQATSLPQSPRGAEPAQLPGLPDADDPLTSLPEFETQPGLSGALPELDSNIQTVTSESPVRTVSTVTAAPGITGSAEFPSQPPAASQRPELTIEKIAPAEATLGEPMIYSIQIANRGTANATQVVIEDLIPKGCRLVGTIPQAELIGTKLMWRLGRLNSGEKKKILVKVVPIEEGEIGSIATVNFESEVANRTTVRQPATPDLQVRVAAPKQARVGQPVVFHFEIENTGKKDATEVSLQNIIPAGFEHPAGRDLTYDIGTLGAGESFEIDLELQAVQPGQHTNLAIVKRTGGEKTESKATVEIVAHNGLKIAKVAGGASSVGQKLVQQITIANESAERVSGANVILVLPRELRFVSASNNGSFATESSTVRWPLPAIESGQSVTIETTAVAGAAGLHSCQVQLTQPGHELQNVTVVRDVRGFAALHLDLKDVPATVFPGDEFAVNVRLLNRGSGADSSVQFGLVIPPELEFVEARGPVKHLAPSPVAGGRQVSFSTIPEIGEGASVDFEITLRAREPGRPKLRAEVRSDQLSEPIASEAAVVVIDTAP